MTTGGDVTVSKWIMLILVKVDRWRTGWSEEKIEGRKVGKLQGASYPRRLSEKTQVERMRRRRRGREEEEKVECGW